MVLDPLELERQMSVSHCGECWRSNLVLWENIQRSFLCATSPAPSFLIHEHSMLFHFRGDICLQFEILHLYVVYISLAGT